VAVARKPRILPGNPTESPMPTVTPTFDFAARIAKDNPQAFYEYRHEMIDRAITCAAAHESLRDFQKRIDALCTGQASPGQSLGAIMEMLAGHLSSLSELLIHWQTVLDLELAQDDTDVHDALARISAMILAVEDLRQEIGSAAALPLGDSAA